MLLWHLYDLCRCFNLWPFARIAGLRISFREMLAMQQRKTNVNKVVRILLAAKNAHIPGSAAEIDEAMLQGVDLETIAHGVNEVGRLGLRVTFQDVLDAARCGSVELLTSRDAEASRELHEPNRHPRDYDTPLIASSVPSGQSFSHIQKSRPLGIAFFVMGAVGLCCSWIYLTSLFPLFVSTVVFGGFVFVGAPAALLGGAYRCRIADGRVDWEYPSRYYGASGSCSLADIVEFKYITDKQGDMGKYVFALRDGSRKTIDQYCFGDHKAFLRALTDGNPAIRFTTSRE